MKVRLSKSSYYYVKSSKFDKYQSLREKIRELFKESKACYGYRKIHALLRKEKIRVSEKVVRRLMKEEELTVKNKRTRKYRSYKGEITPAPANLITRNFHADKQNEKWLSDIIEFAIPAGKVYLSPIVDCW